MSWWDRDPHTDNRTGITLPHARTHERRSRGHVTTTGDDVISGGGGAAVRGEWPRTLRISSTVDDNSRSNAPIRLYTRTHTADVCTRHLKTFLFTQYWQPQLPHRSALETVPMRYIQCESKKSPLYGILKFFPKRLGIFNQFLHTYYTIISKQDYKFLFKYLQLWQSYAILSATT